MIQYYFYKDKVDSAKGLVENSERDTREMLGTLVEILQRKELLSDRDIANIVGIETTDLERSPF
jgi:hypothetical protein|nr:MAG TPA: hypothetical protein [Caudoviricetes sp.]